MAKMKYEIKDLEAAEYLHSKNLKLDQDLYDLAEMIYNKRVMEGRNYNE